MCSLKYITIEQVAKKAVLLGKGSLIAKIDIKSAYRLILVAPADRHYLGMRWKGDTYVDAKLPFGLRSAPKIFNAVADALEWCIASEGVEVIYHYLDDFTVLGPLDSAQCSRNLGTFKTVCRELDITLASEKQAGPTTVIEFLGIIIDTFQQELRLPADKLEQLQHLTMEWKVRIHKQLLVKKRPSCTKEELESLLGIMHHACTVIPAGKAFIRQIISLVHSAMQPYHHMRLNKDFLSDLTWWSVFARHWNGAALISGSYDNEIILTTDALGSWGCGTWCGSAWFQLQWNIKSQCLQIAIKELIPILIASFLWGHNWRRHNVLAYYGNEGVVFTLNKKYSRDPYMAHMLCTLFFVEAHFQFQLQATHIPGSHNTLADFLPRNQWVLDLQMDWTSETWTQLFSTFVSRT